MNDKDWLARVKLGAKVYKETEFCLVEDEVDNFVVWLYQQYGIMYEYDKE